MTADAPTVIARLFQELRGRLPTSLRRLAADASARTMYRVKDEDGSLLVGVVGPEHSENRAFVSFARTFTSLGLPVPAVHAYDEDAGAWLVDDLGNTTLYDAVTAVRETPGDPFPPTLVATYSELLGVLARMQVEGGRHVDFGHAWPRAEYDASAILFDLNSFLFQFLRPAAIPFHEVTLERDFERLTAFLLEAPGSLSEQRLFQHRDFQSRNVMLTEGRPFVIDFQNGRRGPPAYDVAALLHDAKVGLPRDTREALLDDYLGSLGALLEVDGAAFRRTWPGFVLLRILQALGAYGLRGLTERKPSFVARIPHRLADLGRFLEDGFVPIELPALRDVLERCVTAERFQEGPLREPGRLHVHVGSFSYKRGYPADVGGHGGGMVFDCRAVENPGRDPAFREHSGKDAEVRQFLERLPKAGAFFRDAASLVEAQVAVYRDRGFSALDVHFGCTGGQHRSVYFAERLAAHLAELFPDVGVHLAHAQEEHWRRIDPTDATESPEAAGTETA